ncbi:regulator of telomere elongation helicase 1 homolog isoform X2 [Orussus abietinus]|uniref:regulator of telomere elongation helicase 1 homolog isoform X2 n=1 Tax=Orussus abietinus TaxID=222816 RepID=UPI0006265F67|nr:regulator of telomere elongation helicase 1 homolog isoform X2 [Orussus abietinus]
MPDITINGVIVTFPFKPYSVQEEYMAKVIECLQNSKHGVLESPTGTGKTLCLLCSSLSWLLIKKAQMQAQVQAGALQNEEFGGSFFNQLNNKLDKAAGTPNISTNFGWTMPKIIYASRTHSQLSQAMQELKRTSYKHVKVAVLGSRDQLCIHPEVSKEQNSFMKIQMCQAKVKARTCMYYNNVDHRKDDPIFRQDILDIEDLVKASQKVKCCPYFLSKELKQSADITFMPYNYLLDPKTRKTQGIELLNNVVLLDEAHNIEKTCEEAASLQISSTDIALCIDEITAVMRSMANELEQEIDFSSEGSNSVQKDFTAEDLCILKTMFLELEKAVDEIKIQKREEGDVMPGGYIFELLEKIELTHGKEQLVIDKLDKIIVYLSATGTSPFSRRGTGLQKFSDLLRIVFNSGKGALKHREDVKRCYKVYIQPEDAKKNQKTDSWESKKIVKTSEGKLICYWCFSPGFGMQQLAEQGIRSVILTSGTLSPLKPFISEMGIPIDVQLENPHIITGRQVCVGVLSQGPDGHPLNSSFNTRNDPKYIASLGRTVYNFSFLVPHGMLVFFPSYPIMKKCKDEWQNSGLWTKIASRKPIYVEPQSKESFLNIMNEYYEKIQDPSGKGAIFMAVCRGKVSEGLDFANANGRAVLITGLPFPPLKDPRVVLKQKYLEEIRTKDRECLTGQQWYQLEASRAVNQAIGRVIRHQDDYGAIILCDCRFENPNFQKQLSAWLRPHLKKFTNFGVVTKELREFFRYAENTLPQPTMNKVKYNREDYSLPAVPARFNATTTRSSGNIPVSPRAPASKSESYNIQDYVGDLSQAKPGKESKKDFFEMLETSSKSEINFSECQLKGSWTRCELSADVKEPATKKRKLKVLPVEFNANLSEPSTSAQPKSKTTPEGSEDKPLIETKSIDEKREMGKEYLKNVKRVLSEDKYKMFAKIIQSYTKDGNFQELIDTLEILFPANENLGHLFKGFRSFLKKQHIERFDMHVKVLDALNF